MKGKLERQQMIREVVSGGRVSSQEELSAILEGRGVKVAQATLSRDVKELGITKLHDGDGYYYSLPRLDARRGAASRADNSLSSIESIEFSGALAVLKTPPGHAAMVASVIDAGPIREAAGTIAGDDTVILVIREGCSRDDLVRSLGKIFRNVERKRIH